MCETKVFVECYVYGTLPVLMPSNFRFDVTTFMCYARNSCIYVLVPLAPQSAALLSPPAAASRFSGQTDGAGGGSGNTVLPVGCTN